MPIAESTVSFLFPTPLLVARFDRGEQVNPPLLDKLLAARTSEGMITDRLLFQRHAKPRSGSSQADLHHRGWEELDVLMEFFATCVSSIMRQEKTAPSHNPAFSESHWGDKVQIVEVWSSFVEPGDAVPPHPHPGAAWTGVYQVDSDPEHDQALTLYNPCPGAVQSDTPSAAYTRQMARVRLEPGVLAVFPGYVVHGVSTYRGRRPRVCLAFNAVIDDGGFRQVFAERSTT